MSIALVTLSAYQGALLRAFQSGSLDTADQAKTVRQKIIDVFQQKIFPLHAADSTIQSTIASEIEAEIMGDLLKKCDRETFLQICAILKDVRAHIRFEKADNTPPISPYASSTHSPVTYEPADSNEDSHEQITFENYLTMLVQAGEDLPSEQHALFIQAINTHFDTEIYPRWEKNNFVGAFSARDIAVSILDALDFLDLSDDERNDLGDRIEAIASKVSLGSN